MTYQPKTTTEQREAMRHIASVCNGLSGHETIMLFDDLAACEAALAEEQRKHQWQPIETAPKDKYNANMLLRYRCDKSYMVEYYVIEGWWDGVTGKWRAAHLCQEIENVTHWQPLPQPPERSV